MSSGGRIGSDENADHEYHAPRNYSGVRFLGGDVMDNFVVIYRILKALEASMDFEEFDEQLISPERLGITKERRDKLLIQMQKEGYISGISVVQYVNLASPSVDIPNSISITIKGLEYLAENSLMKKAANLAKGVAEILF